MTQKSEKLSGAQKWTRGIIPDKENREKDDFYPTPPEGTLALLKVETFAGPIWEPACGDGAISKVLCHRGYSVQSTDLVDRGYGTPRIDFLMETGRWEGDVVTNPPFKMAEEFILQALHLATGKVAILARLAFLEGQARRKLFESTPLANVWVFSKRLLITRPNLEYEIKGGMIAFAWYVWDHSHEGPPRLGWIEPVR